MMYFIDLFCGAGGVTSGVVKARHNGKAVAKVVACINHDAMAIASHKANHKRVLHFTEDIRTINISPIIKRVNDIRKANANATICLWASLECTNFSKAKGGQPRDADSRTLAEHLFRYIEGIDPDMIYIENVEEFMCWGPLDENGKPISRREGSDYVRWVNNVQAHGYYFDYRIINAADFGAYTTRRRYFAQFAKDHIKIQWPTASHCKDGLADGLFAGLQKYKAVREVLDLQDEGRSIFNRDKPLSDKTYERIYAGLIKYVAGMNKKAFLSKYYSGKPDGKNITIDGPAGAITCIDSHALIQPKFLTKYYGNGDNTASINQPCGTITTKDRIALASAKYFLDKQFTSGKNHQSIEVPAGSITTVPKFNLVKIDPFIMSTHFGNGCSSIDAPAKTITANRKYDYLINMNSSTAPATPITNPAPTITVARTHYLINPSWGGNNQDIEKPCCVVVARQDKAPLYLTAVQYGNVAVPVYENDTEIVIRIKEFMAIYDIEDIKMRMLKIPELLKIQGFDDSYVLKGNQAQQKKMIGNSCEVNVIKNIVQASYQGILATEDRRLIA
jgi:DNA (cytosine-5)-methyltransferase 1